MNSNCDTFSSGCILLFNPKDAQNSWVASSTILSLQYKDLSFWGMNLAGHIHPCAYCIIVLEMPEGCWLFLSLDGKFLRYQSSWSDSPMCLLYCRIRNGWGMLTNSFFGRQYLIQFLSGSWVRVLEAKVTTLLSTQRQHKVCLVSKLF